MSELIDEVYEEQEDRCEAPKDHDNFVVPVDEVVAASVDRRRMVPTRHQPKK